METRKTIREWLMELPDGYRERAVANTDPSKLCSDCRSTWSAVGEAFDWSESPEGHSFWSRVSDFLNEDCELPPLPENTITVSAGSGLTGEHPKNFLEDSPLDCIAVPLIIATVSNLHANHEIGDEKIRQCYETAKRILEIRREFV